MKEYYALKKEERESRSAPWPFSRRRHPASGLAQWGDRHRNTQNAPRQWNRVSTGIHKSAAGKAISNGGFHKSGAGKVISNGGFHKSTTGKAISSTGFHTSSAGKAISNDGFHKSGAGKAISSIGFRESSTGKAICCTGVHKSVGGKTISPRDLANRPFPPRRRAGPAIEVRHSDARSEPPPVYNSYAQIPRLYI